MVERLAAAEREDDDARALRQENEALLAARALALARARQGAPAEEECLAVVLFLVNEEKYALELSYIREVYPLLELTELPGVPPFVAGVVNVRGQIVAVNDLRQFFDLPAAGFSDKNRIIILKGEGMEFGLLADAVLGVRRIPLGEIVPSLPTLTGIRAQFLKGVSSEQVVILDGGKLLAAPQFLVGDR